MTKNLTPLDTICDLKWNYPIFNMARGEFRSCCRTIPNKVTDNDLEEQGIDAFLNSPKMKESRFDLVKGVQTHDCRSCWQIEDVGMKSPRHSPELFWQLLSMMRPKYLKSTSLNLDFHNYNEKLMLTVLDQIKDPTHPLLEARRPYMLEINMGNTCDMKCMYCNHHYSSQWAAEEIKLGRITQEQYDKEFSKPPKKFGEKFWEWFDQIGIHSLHRIGIIGGEPLIMPDFYKFADRFIEIKKQNDEKNEIKRPIKFWIVTNLNTPPVYLEKILEYLPKLTEVFDVEILVSLEAVGKRAEYIRNGLNWERFRSNLGKILSRNDLNFEFGFLPSLNVLSIASLKEFVMFSEELYKEYGMPIALKHNIVNYPNWQSPFILTPDFADHVDDCISYMETKVDVMPIVSDDYGRWDAYIDYLKILSKSLRENSTDKFNERKKFVKWYDDFDQKRKLNLLETFPEYTNFYNYCKSL